MRPRLSCRSDRWLPGRPAILVDEVLVVQQLGDIPYQLLVAVVVGGAMASRQASTPMMTGICQPPPARGQEGAGARRARGPGGASGPSSGKADWVLGGISTKEG